MQTLRAAYLHDLELLHINSLAIKVSHGNMTMQIGDSTFMEVFSQRRICQACAAWLWHVQAVLSTSLYLSLIFTS